MRWTKTLQHTVRTYTYIYKHASAHTHVNVSSRKPKKIWGHGSLGCRVGWQRLADSVLFVFLHRMSHGTLTKQPFHIHECVISHAWISCVTHMNQPCHTYGWVMSRTWVRHNTHIHETGHPIYMTWRFHVSGLSHVCVCHVAIMCVTWLIDTCDMADSYVSHERFTRVIWRIRICEMAAS